MNEMNKSEISDRLDFIRQATTGDAIREIANFLEDLTADATPPTPATPATPATPPTP